MKKKMIWGLSIFTILLIGAFAFIMYQQKVQLNQWKADAAARTAKDKKLAAAEKPLMEKNNLPLPPLNPDTNGNNTTITTAKCQSLKRTKHP